MKTMKNAWSRMALAPLAAALLLAGCATALPPAEPLAGVQPPAAFSTPQEQASWTTAAPAEAQPRGEWWRAFADAELTALVERAAVANTDVQTAAARLTEARALLRSADAQRMPQLGASAGAARQAGANTANGTQPATLLTAGLNLSYEVDLFGRLSNASEAARQDAQAQAALLQSTRLMVQADVAQTYLQLRSLQTERQLVQQSLSAYRDTLRLIESRHRAGDAAELDVVRMQSEVSTTEAETLALERQQATLTHALAVLVGDVATGFVLPAPAGQTALPVIPAGVPATVLARRPDVSAAQARVLAAQARVGVAQAAWFPAISLTGAGALPRPIWATSSSGRPAPGDWVRCCRCRSSMAVSARRRRRVPRPVSKPPWPSSAGRCLVRCATSRTSSARCACCRARPRCWGRPCNRPSVPRISRMCAIATAL